MVDGMASTIDDKFVLLRSLFTHLNEYFEIAADIMIRVDPSTHGKFAKELGELRQLIDTAEQLARSAKTLAEHLKSSSQIENITQMLFSMASVLNTPYYETKITTTKSVGFQIQIREMMEKIVGEIQKYRTMTANSDAAEILSIVNGLQLNTAAGRESTISTILETTTPSRLIVEVIKRIVKEDPATIGKLSPVIERLKNLALGGDTMVMGTATAQSIEPWLTYQLDLVPATNYMTGQELCAELNPAHAYDDTADVHANLLACSGDSSLLFVSRSADREIDYCVLGLIDDEYIHAHQLHTNQTSGLNKRVIRRFSSLRDVLADPVVASAAPRFTIRGSNCYVVTELGSKYRVLGVGSGSVSKTVPTDFAAKLLKPMSARPINYHAIQSDYILSISESLEHRSIIRWYEESRLAASPQTNAFKVDLVKRIVDSVVIDSHTHNDPKSFAELCRSSYQQGLVAETIKFLNERNLAGREKRSTFTVRISGLITAYEAALDKVLTGLTPGQFSERGDVARHLKGIYTDVTRATVEALDVAPSKFQQLGITLKEQFLKSHGGGAV